jgi:hypothetical protein
VSYLITFAVLLALPLTVLGLFRQWVALIQLFPDSSLMTLAAIAFLAIPVLAYVFGRVWGRHTTLPGTVWPAVLTMWTWWVMDVVVRIWRLGPMLAAMSGVPSRSATFLETLMFVRPLIAIALVVTAAAAIRIVRATPERVPPGRVAIWSVGFATLVTLVMPYAGEEIRLRGQEAQVTRVASLESPEQISRELERLSELPRGDAAVRKIADDETLSPELRARAVARLLTMARDIDDPDALRRADTILRNGSVEERITVVDGFVAFGWSDEVRPSLRLAARDPDARVRARAAWKLRVIGRSEDRPLAYDVLEEILEHLQDYNDLDVHTVQCSLYHRALVRDETASRILENILADPAVNPEHRELARLAEEYLASTKDSQGYVTPPYELWKGCPQS